MTEAVLAAAAFGSGGWGWWAIGGGLLALAAGDLWARRETVKFSMPFFEREPPFNLTPEPADPTAEDVRVPVPGVTNDRGEPLALAVAVTPAAGETRGVVVFCAETGGSRWFWRRYAAALPGAGFAIVSFDHRSTHDSDAEPGYVPGHWPEEREVADALAVVRRTLDDPRFAGLPVGLFGVSRGACVALAAAAREPRVAAVASDSGFVTDGVVTGFARKWASLAVPKWLEPYIPTWHIRQTMWIMRKVAERRKGVKFLALQRDLPKLRRRPVWLVNGGRDSYVTPLQLDRLSAATGAEAWVVPGAKHNAAREKAGTEYDRRLVAFFAAHPPPPAAPSRAARTTPPAPAPSERSTAEPSLAIS